VAFLPLVIVGLFGLVFGSFLNVCIARLPRHESIVSPRSHCPRCHHLIRWYDNLPVLSFVLLRGKCRDCLAPISPVYPLVEILTGALLVADFAVYGFSQEFVKYGLLGMLLLILVFTDLNERRIPHSVTLFGIVLGLILSFFVPVDARPVEWLLRRFGYVPGSTLLSLLGALAGAALGGGLFYAVGEAFYYLGGRQKEYLGFGDVMLMFMVGIYLGVPLTLLTILLGSLLGTLIAVPLELTSQRFRHSQWPYGAFLGIAAVYASLGGSTLLDAYLRWAGLQ
jgi:leader peptidase (prepilin peptidase)/N-methyltransferase